MSETTEKLNSSVSSGSEGHKSSSAGDGVKKSVSNHTNSNNIPHKNHSGSPLKKPSSGSSKPKDGTPRPSSSSSSKPKPSSSSKSSNHSSSSSSKSGTPKPSSSSTSSSKDKPSNGVKPKDPNAKPRVSSSGDGSKSSSSVHKSGSSSSKSGSSSSKSGSSSTHKSSSSSSHKSGSSSSKSGSSSTPNKSSSSSSSTPKSGSSSVHKSGSSSAHKSGSSSSQKSGSSSAHKSSSSSSKTGSSSTPKSGSSSSSAHKSGSSSSSAHKSGSSSHKSSSSSSAHKSSSSSSKPKSSSSSSSSKPSSSSSKPSSSSSSSKHSSSKDKPKSSSDASKVKKEGDAKVKTEPESDSSKVKSEPMSPKKEVGSPVKVKKEEDSKASIKKEVDEKPSKKRGHEDEEEKVDTKKQKTDDKKRIKEEESRESRKRKKVKEESEEEFEEEEEDDEYEEPVAKKKQKKDKKDKKKGGEEKKKKKKKGEKEEEEVWKWWEEEPLPDGMKWRFLEHKGPVFAPPYEPLPDHIEFYYNGKVMKLSEPTEEVAGFYARMLDHDYTTKEVFNKNFFNDWKKEMTEVERSKITSLDKCNFNKIGKFYKEKSEANKNRTKEEKLKLKETNADMVEEYGFCMMDSHREKIGNFRIEPPGLFRGRGDHPKMGKFKKRIQPEDVIINCAKDAVVPSPPKGHKWKKVIHDNKVSWLSTWTENIQGQNKYIMLNPSSRLKGEKDWQKYEVARNLKKIISKIRENYHEDFKSKEMRCRQRAVAMYFIDKLALRAGNEKEEGESADTVGCCSLRVEHVSLHEEKGGKEFVVEFDFLGKDSIRYQNSVPVEKRAFKNLKLFCEGKAGKDDLFDRLNTATLNQHLRDLMDGLTAKVFRTYNASSTLQSQLKELTNPDDTVVSKELSYNRANRAVAILCNHQRAAPKTFDKQMENLQNSIEKKHEDIKKAKKEYKALKQDYKESRNEKIRSAVERKKKQVERLQEQLMKLDIKSTDKQENKEIALGTSKLNYLDPRISVAWTKKYEVPLEKVYNKTQREKFRWAIDMAEADFVF